MVYYWYETWSFFFFLTISQGTNMAKVVFNRCFPVRGEAGNSGWSQIGMDSNSNIK